MANVIASFGFSVNGIDRSGPWNAESPFTERVVMSIGCGLGFCSEKLQSPVVPMVTLGKLAPLPDPGEHAGSTVTVGAATEVASSRTLVLFT